jgi:hypothetical protein
MPSGVALLNGKYSLLGIEDVERFAGSAISRSKYVHRLNAEQRESLAVYVIEEVWRSSLRFDSERNADFATFAYVVASRSVIDWFRLEFGRTTWKFKTHTYERKLPQLVSLDADNSERDRMEQPLGAGRGDPATDSAAAFDGLHRASPRRRSPEGSGPQNSRSYSSSKSYGLS